MIILKVTKLEDIFSQKNQRGGGGQIDPTAF